MNNASVEDRHRTHYGELKAALAQTASPDPPGETENVNAFPKSPSLPDLEPTFHHTSPPAALPEPMGLPVKQLVKVKSTIPSPNDFSYLVEEIQSVTNDHHSVAFTRIAREADEASAFRALSITRLAMEEQSIAKPGAYFNRVVQEISGFSFGSNQLARSKPSPDSPPQPIHRIPVNPVATQQKEEIDPNALVNAWKLLYRTDSKLQSVLAMIGRCLPEWNVHEAWESLKADRVGETEESVLDEMLELCAFKLKMAFAAATRPAT